MGASNCIEEGGGTMTLVLQGLTVKGVGKSHRLPDAENRRGSVGGPEPFDRKAAPTAGLDSVRTSSVN